MAAPLSAKDLDGFGVYTERFLESNWGVHGSNDYVPGTMRQLSLDVELGSWGVTFFIRFEKKHAQK